MAGVLYIDNVWLFLLLGKWLQNANIFIIPVIFKDFCVITVRTS